MNLLILSCGTRNKIIAYFKEALAGRGKVIAADHSPLAPALYEADEAVIIPHIQDKQYLDTLLTLCKEKQIKAIFSLIDPELNLLAKHQHDFLAIDTVPIISDADKVELCFNKYALYEFLTEKQIPTPKSYLNEHQFYQDMEKGKISFPVFVKPYNGSASAQIHKAHSSDEMEDLILNGENMMIQEFMDGIEIGADVYVDLHTGKVVSIFTKEKINMRAGETDKARSFKDEQLFEFIQSVVEETGLKGMLDIDLFKVGDQYLISEINPRFGGGYPHAYGCGVSFPKMLLNNLAGKENRVQIGEYESEIYMAKFNDVMIMPAENLAKEMMVSLSPSETAPSTQT
ncbi:ATP-grasp domain-containing protein [Pisciglobus halotolerans]|uniref:Carbamoyl-phosphate synthase large subunit n=1 Tax=Pisciglobus halotolerans TaxID=745365 RepID=A0A1I3AVT9_9LACT|nr:ATP-grasp domain-containing protein [Pisciglobus halotolerans]SFH54205.1 carbamoyl-phosphate synthase large subunit [Pisciglobus halotolerans]